MSLSMFFSFEEVADYITNTLGIKYLDNPSGWVDACKELSGDARYIKIVNDITGETSSVYTHSNILEGVGEFHIGENYSGPQTITGGGGVKSAPT